MKELSEMWLYYPFEILLGSFVPVCISFIVSTPIFVDLILFFEHVEHHEHVCVVKTMQICSRGVTLHHIPLPLQLINFTGFWFILPLFLFAKISRYIYVFLFPSSLSHKKVACFIFIKNFLLLKYSGHTMLVSGVQRCLDSSVHYLVLTISVVTICHHAI